MQKIKLKLEVNLISNRIIGTTALESYALIIKFLDKDERFESNFTVKTPYTYTSKNGFKIISMWDEPYGAIKDNSILIPRLDKIGFELKKVFLSDSERYNYVKKLYDALEDWSNNWTLFISDSFSTIDMNNNVWTIGYKIRHQGLYKFNHNDKKSIQNNIFI